MSWLLASLAYLSSEAKVAGYLENKITEGLYGPLPHINSSSSNIAKLAGNWRIFKVNFLYFSIHLSHSATQRFAETASGSGGIIEHMKSSLVSAKKGYSVPLHHSSEHFDYFGDIKYWK